MSEKLIPEIALYKVLVGLKKLMKIDYNTHTDKDKTILSSLFKGISMESFNFLEVAVNLFLKGSEQRRNLEITVGYNMERMEMPTIHILLPSETPVSAPIGGNEGYEDYYIEEQEVEEGEEQLPPLKSAVYSFENQVVYNLLITSNNTLETILLYNWLKYCFVSIHPHMELIGFRNLKFGGSDLNFDDTLIPREVFHRNFNLSFEYEFHSRDFHKSQIANKFLIDDILLADDEQSIEDVISQR